MKKKLSLKELSVTSFITSPGPVHSIAGGGTQSTVCVTPIMMSRDADCPFTRFDNYCTGERTRVC